MLRLVSLKIEYPESACTELANMDAYEHTSTSQFI